MYYKNQGYRYVIVSEVKIVRFLFSSRITHNNTVRYVYDILLYYIPRFDLNKLYCNNQRRDIGINA